jgi:eIF3 subunit 6 N terminal domain
MTERMVAQLIGPCQSTGQLRKLRQTGVCPSVNPWCFGGGFRFARAERRGAPPGMAEYDVTFELSKHLDRHLVFPLLEFLSNKELYDEDQIQVVL